MKHGLLLAILLLSMGAGPRREYGPDPHIQTFYYNPETVVQLTGAVGWQMMIEFADDERIENVSIGDSAAWQVTPNKRAHMLFVKPLSRKASTNMTVITSQRHYSFNLSVGPRQARTPWVVRFDYPAPPPAPVELPPPPPPPIALDFSYAMAGDAALLPSRVWDDGHLTYFEFAQDTALPAIFALGQGKKDESMVNSSVRGRVVVVQQRSARFILRMGKRSAIITKRSAALSKQP